MRRAKDASARAVRWPRLVTLLLTVGAAAALAGCITDRILVSDAEGAGPIADPAQLRRVEAQTAKIRHLPFLKTVPADVMTVAELRAWFDRFADARRAELERDDRFFHRVGLLPPTVSTAEAYKGFIADFVGGVYDDGRERMILVSDYAWWAKAQQDLVGAITGIDWAYELFLVHELNHALQDQHFGLGEMLRGGVYDDNDDAAFVRKTLLESEANVVGMSHFLGMDLDRLATRKLFFLFLRYNNLLNGPILLALAGRTPSFFARQALSQYELGLTFVERKLDEGGMDELSRAYVRKPGERGSLPESTEQLMWPRKMRAGSVDRPIPIARIEGPLITMPEAGLLSTNVFGALAFRHWFETVRGPLEAATVADGWGGDRWDLFDDAGASVLLWRTTWDSEEDARQFFDAYSAAVPRRYGERAKRAGDEEAFVFEIPAAPQEERFIRTLRAEHLVIERRGRDVLIVEGARPEISAALVDEAWGLHARAPAPAVDEARLRERARLLEEHIQEVPPPSPRPDLLGRLFLPARTMAARIGTGVGVDARTDPAPPSASRSVFALTDGELRWGFRPHLEVSLPFALAGEIRTPFGQSVAGVALDGISPTLRFNLSASHAVPLGERVVVAGQAGVDGVGGVEGGTRLALGALLRPFDALVVAPAVARVDDSAPSPMVVIGAALRRGVTTQPLLELEVVDGLSIYQSSAFFFDQRARGLSLLAHTHVMGLLLYF
jgi:hypothetical protein